MNNNKMERLNGEMHAQTPKAIKLDFQESFDYPTLRSDDLYFQNKKREGIKPFGLLSLACYFLADCYDCEDCGYCRDQ